MFVPLFIFYKYSFPQICGIINIYNNNLNILERREVITLIQFGT